MANELPSPAHYLHFRSYNPNLSVTALLDEDVSEVTDGYGGWSEQDRARRRSLTIWTGTKTFKMSIPILFDGFVDDKDISPSVRTLERMATSPGPDATPIIKITGHIPHIDKKWVIQELEWGESLRRFGGQLVRQHMVVHVWEHITNKLPKVTATQKTKDKAKTRKTQSADERTYTRTTYGYSVDPGSVAGATTTYTAQHGDTLTSIASAQLGDYNNWKLIADLNGLSDPLKPFNGGERLKLPTL